MFATIAAGRRLLGGGGQVDDARAERRHVQQRVRPRRDARPRQVLPEARDGKAALPQLQVNPFVAKFRVCKLQPLI